MIPMKINDQLLKKYAPMTETAFYILYCLQSEDNGYNITKRVLDLTDGDVNIGAGTMYGSLSKFEKDGLITHTRKEEKRIYYQVTDLGQALLDKEINRIKRIAEMLK